MLFPLELYLFLIGFGGVGADAGFFDGFCDTFVDAFIVGVGEDVFGIILDASSNAHGGGEHHVVIDSSRIGVDGASEEAREDKDIVDPVWIFAASGSDDIGAALFG